MIKGVGPIRWAVLLGKRISARSSLKRRFAGPRLELVRIESFAAFLEYERSRAAMYAKRIEVEENCKGEGEEFRVPAYCYTCAKYRPLITTYAYSFETENGGRSPNWREHLLCPSCGLNNRMRAAIQLLEQESARHQESIYITEQKTPLYRWMKDQYPDVQGSEYLGDIVPHGNCDENGIRNETLTNLTWDDRTFDLVLSFDVFEHIPNYLGAFKECARILKRDGKMLFTIPFLAHNRHNVTRARVTGEGTIEHLLPPEYHGDPLCEAGCLAFHIFGWEMLDEIRNCGFRKVEALFYWSRELGYLGVDQMAFLAEVE